MILLAALSVILSEVLANEPGSQTVLEWIEVEALEHADLGLYRLVAAGDTVTFPDTVVDAGFVVVCRNLARFEGHRGDSSGVWGDDPAEDYLLVEAAFSLPNSSGTAELVGPGGRDVFTWDGSAPDGASYERIGDSAWQVTSVSVGSTPGRRNDGVAAHLDWSIERVTLQGLPPFVAGFVHVLISVANQGIDSSSTALRLTDSAQTTLEFLTLAGGAGEVRDVLLLIPVHEGLNRFLFELDTDERPGNNLRWLAFFAGDPPVAITEIYAGPEGNEPEWLEVYVRPDPALPYEEFTLADLQDTASVLFAMPAPAQYIILTPDAAAFVRDFGVTGITVIEAADWPTLNNNGDTLALFIAGALVDRVGYPSVDSRRGLALERIGTSQVWGWSVAPGGSTPGIPNSIDVAYTPGIEIEITPNPFAPGFGETAQIAYRVPFDARGDLRLFSGDGRPLRTLFDDSRIVSGRVNWDGRDSDGRLLPVGMYLLQFRLYEPRELSRLAPVVIAR